jgi:hypothetical protein
VKRSYREMNELNNDAPRKIFRQEREKNGNPISEKHAIKKI